MASSPAPSIAPTARASGGPGANYLPALSILTTLFFMWGFLTCLNDIIIPHLKAVFELTYFRAMLVQFCFFAAYAIMSVPSGLIVEKIGYKRGIIIGLGGAALGCVLFYPAAGIRSFELFLFAFFVLASGITLLQVAANPYVAILGKPETASSRLTLTQAFNSLGTTIAPYFGSVLILANAVKSPDELKAMSSADVVAYKVAEASSVQLPYLALAGALILVAIGIAMCRLPTIAASEASGEGDNGNVDHLHTSAWGYRHLVLGAVGIFAYVGGEVAIGSLIVNFLQDLQIDGMTIEKAGKLLMFYWGGAMVGRFIGSVVMRYVKPSLALTVHATAVILLVILSILAKGQIAMWSILAVGLFNSIMFPTIFTLAINGLGKHTGQGSGILCMAIVGGALVPALQGILADHIGLQLSFVIPVLCYAYIVYYGLFGSKPAHHGAALRA
ncbi:MAG: L-fucose:H+ symporter permease [Opitutaceae bacterium]|nr:L-fucose:H+ symporter permease [Opitutaceae bacterium]